MSTVLLPMKRFVEAPPELALADGEAEADEVGEASPVGDAAPSATLTCVLAGGPAGPASDGPPQPATAASMAAATAIVNAGCQGRHHRKGRICMNSYVVRRDRMRAKV
jgi:hypothetical protein